MKVTDQDVLHVAALANLELTADEMSRLGRDLNNILGYVELLNEVDTSHSAASTQTSTTNAFRADAVTAGDTPPADEYSRVKRSLTRADAVRNAPASDGQYFKVPKVIER